MPLTSRGVEQAQSLARRLLANPPDAIHSSPVQRARETARAIGEACEREVEIAGALDEVDFGDWTGRAFAELEGDEAWRLWNERRSDASAPGGESMSAARDRALRHVHQAAALHAGGTVVMVTHCDIIRALVAAILGLSLDRILQFDVGPASISRIAAGPWGARLKTLNEGAA